jgi:hypothetical protein
MRKYITILAGCAAFAAIAALLPAGDAAANHAIFNLKIDGLRVANTLRVDQATFGPGSCAVAEGCAAAGQRTLVRFDVAIVNEGPQDLVAEHWVGRQSKRNPNFEYGTCHHHYHLREFTSYRLLDLGQQFVLAGRKEAFCLMDIDNYGGTGRAKFTCTKQGITAGWADVYGSYLDCQWLDVTGVAPGTYLLEVTINAPRASFGGVPAFGEQTLADNTALVQVTIP